MKVKVITSSNKTVFEYDIQQFLDKFKDLEIVSQSHSAFYAEGMTIYSTVIIYK